MQQGGAFLLMLYSRGSRVPTMCEWRATSDSQGLEHFVVTSKLSLGEVFSPTSDDVTLRFKDKLDRSYLRPQQAAAVTRQLPLPAGLMSSSSSPVVIGGLQPRPAGDLSQCPLPAPSSPMPSAPFLPQGLAHRPPAEARNLQPPPTLADDSPFRPAGLAPPFIPAAAPIGQSAFARDELLLQGTPGSIMQQLQEQASLVAAQQSQMATMQAKMDELTRALADRPPEAHSASNGSRTPARGPGEMPPAGVVVDAMGSAARRFGGDSGMAVSRVARGDEPQPEKEEEEEEDEEDEEEEEVVVVVVVVEEAAAVAEAAAAAAEAAPAFGRRLAEPVVCSRGHGQQYQHQYEAELRQAPAPQQQHWSSEGLPPASAYHLQPAPAPADGGAHMLLPELRSSNTTPPRLSGLLSSARTSADGFGGLHDLHASGDSIDTVSGLLRGPVTVTRKTPPAALAATLPAPPCWCGPLACRSTHRIGSCAAVVHRDRPVPSGL